MNHSRIAAIQPRKAVEGGRISIHGEGFPIEQTPAAGGSCR